MNDPSQEVRIAAAQRCTDLSTLASAWTNEAAPGVKNAIATALAGRVRTRSAIRSSTSSGRKLSGCRTRRSERRARICGPVDAASSQRARRTTSEEESHGFDEDRLAGAGLAGQDVEAPVELDLDGVDYGQALDAEEAEHVKKARTSIVT